MSHETPQAAQVGAGQDAAKCWSATANHPAVVEAYLGRDPEALAEGS